MKKALQHSVLTSTTARRLIGVTYLSAFVALSAVDVAADPVSFGKALSFSSEQNTSYAPTDDKQAFSIDFNGLEIGLGRNPVATPVVTRSYSMVIPVSDADKGAEIPFNFQGYALCLEGVNAYAVFSVNGQTSAISFPPGHDDSFVHTMKFKAPYADDLRVTIFLSLERDARHADAEGVKTLKKKP
ncbi:hypothetical protein [Taklimakanibacter albus]|uniref:Uncharacterized protein n=1 Tax=Taklimakanibacter albus TaxID=2800327 RepID=A0ACC5RCQ3_9HYPH|nr:hypothetical protein [Aestuariivirga sp. YIM B02566]MBK1870173.1 hypothetical protein [Aestuariivirga sp. YIM B02566]